MRSIRNMKDIDRTEYAEVLNSAIKQLRDDGVKEDKIPDTLISALAFKYWHENCSCQVNSAIESTDTDYVRLHWGLFCKSKIGQTLCPKARNVNMEHIAHAIGRLSKHITHRHCDKENVDLISQLGVLIESQTGLVPTDRVVALKLVCDRELTRKHD